MGRKARTARMKELITEGVKYKEANETIKEEFGEGVAGSSYSKMKSKLFPEEQVTGALEKSSEKREKKKEKKDTPKKTSSDFKAEQEKADDSKMAGILNKGFFFGIPCPNKELKQEDIDEINPGGAIVGVMQYYVPQFDVNHPVVVLLLRSVLLLVKVKRVCYTVKEKVGEAIHGGEQK